MSKRFKDFDAAQDAKNPEPIKIKVNETEYEFPPFLSASVVLEQLTWIGEDGAVLGKLARGPCKWVMV